MEDTVDDREEKGVEDLEDVGLRVNDRVRIRQSVGAPKLQWETSGDAPCISQRGDRGS